MSIQRIIQRIEDDELHVDDRQIREHASDLSNKEIGDLVKKLNREIYDLKAPSASPAAYRYVQMAIHRRNRAIAGLKQAIEWRAADKKRALVHERASESKRTGKETCVCGKDHPRGSRYFTSAVHAGRTSLLMGPYHTHAEALAVVDKSREAAEAVDPQAPWYSYGTLALIRSSKKKSVFGV